MVGSVAVRRDGGGTFGRLTAPSAGARALSWRLSGSEVTHEALDAFNADFPGFRRDRLFYNMSVWESVDDLRAYTFGSAHAEMLNDRYQWIDHIEGASVALWWIPAGHRPTVAESAERLRSVRNAGPTADAFTLRKSFPRPGLA